MITRFRWAAVLFITAIPLAAHAQVAYSPVFHQPLQPAPSPINGGYYWVLPDGRLWGPNYYLVPPFNPISGPSTTLVGQKTFVDVYTQYLKNGSAQIAKHSHQGQPKNLGVGAYNQDFSDPQNLTAFDQHNSLGFQPFQPQPRPAGPVGMPTYPTPPSPPAQAYYWPAPSNYVMAQYAPVESYRAYYQPNYAVAGQIVQAQAPAPPPPASPASPPNPATYANPRVYPPCPTMPPLPGLPAPAYNPNVPPLPGLPYSFPSPTYSPGMPGLPGLPSNLPNPGYSPPMPGLPNAGYAPQSMPYLPYPGYTPNQFPSMPSPYYSPQFPQFPRLPSPGCEPSQCQQGCGNPGYFHPAGIRSPRDFFMYGDVKEDERLREARALQVP